MPKISDRFLHFILLGVAVVFISTSITACSNAGRRMATVFKWNTKITVIVDKDANQTSGIAVDVVSPLTDKTEEALMKMTARKWFTNKQQFSRDYLVGNDYLVEHREFVPDSTPDPITIPFKVNTKALIIYAYYLSKGKHRYRSTLPGEDLELHLMRYKFTVKPEDSDYGNMNKAGANPANKSNSINIKKNAEKVAQQAKQYEEQQQAPPQDDTSASTTDTSSSDSSDLDSSGEIDFGF